jgi:hypothetical protein
MPTLEEATKPLRPDLFERVPVSPATLYTPPPFVNPDSIYSVRSNVNLRSPAPPINVSPDNLRQYYRGGQVPQARILSPPTLANQAATTSTVKTTTVSTGSTSTTTSGVSPAGQTVGITTPALNVGQIYTTVVQIAKSFIIQKIGVNAPSRVELYETAAQQAADMPRSMAIPVPIGTKHGIICDMQLAQPSELSWICSPVFDGSNADSPQSTSVYITVTNIGAFATAIAITFSFVPTQS